MAHNDIEDTLDHLIQIKSGGDLDSIKIDQIETLEMELKFLRTFIKYHHALLPISLDKITKKAMLIAEMLHLVFDGISDECKTNFNVERLISQMQESIKANTSSRYNYELELNDFYLLEYMDCLDKNLNNVPRYLYRSNPSLAIEMQILHGNGFLKQVKVIQKKMRFLRYVYAIEIKGFIDHEKLEGLETQMQFMADNVGQFCLGLWVNVVEDGTDSDEVEDDTDSVEVEDDTDSVVVEDDTDFVEVEDDANSEDEDDRDSDEDEDDRDSDEDEDDIDSDSNEDGMDDILSKPPYLLCLIVLVQLEMKKIFLGELKASKFSQSRTFKNQKFPKGFSHHLHSLLVYLKSKKLVESFPNNVSARNIDMAIEFLLFLLVNVPNHVINGKRLNEVLEKVGPIVGDILCLVQKLRSSIIKDDTSKINLCSVQILEKIENLMAQVEERCYKSLKFTQSQFPTVGGLSFLDSLLRRLNAMLKSESSLDFTMKPRIIILEKELSSLTSIFRDVSKVNHAHEVLKDLQKRTINLANEAEVAIDSILAQYNALWHLFCSLPAIIKEIKHISAEVTEIWSDKLALNSYFAVEPSIHKPFQQTNLMNDEEIVGFENDEEKIIQYLIRGTNELDVIPIVGMGGQGKTTISRKVYKNNMIVSHFDCLAWCCISQTYNRIELLREIYSQVFKNNIVGKDDEIADKLRKSLTSRRYLIVLDDMWDVKAWEELRLSFPNGERSSRIIITTRLEEVGKQVKHHTNPYFLPFLTPKESCQLLQKKVFQKEGCPPELQDVSQAVAERCKGLPLVVVLAAGIIKKKRMEESWWHEVKTTLFSCLGESEDYSLSTMHLSYDNLPDYLRPCILYMGMFPEDHKIPVSKLISLWIAEGFVQNIDSGRLEEVAEDYLMDLISSNLVMVSRRRYDGKVKLCQVHDVVLHFCLEKSREEMFMRAVKGNDSLFRPFDWKECRVSIYFTNRLSMILQKPFHRHLRSLITIYRTNERARIYWNLFPHISNCRIIKVLDLMSLRFSVLSSATFDPLVCLKYLSFFAAQFDFEPESHLWNLETLLVRTNLNNKVVLPANFWKMEKLRRVEILADCVKFEGISNLKNSKQQMIEESSKLENLRILRTLQFPIGAVDEVDVLLQRCPSLQELEIQFYCNQEVNDSAVKFETLTQLQVLDLFLVGGMNASELHLPSNLKKLILRGPHVASTASLIAGLPNLEYLKLKWDSDSGEWCLGDITFHKLKFLKLSNLDISSWEASEASFPLLETLVIKECNKLEEIPIGFADIQTLKQIDLKWCKSSLEASAVKIMEEVEAIEGCDRLDLIIHDLHVKLPQL